MLRCCPREARRRVIDRAPRLPRCKHKCIREKRLFLSRSPPTKLLLACLLRVPLRRCGRLAGAPLHEHLREADQLTVLPPRARPRQRARACAGSGLRTAISAQHCTHKDVRTEACEGDGRAAAPRRPLPPRSPAAPRAPTPWRPRGLFAARGGDALPPLSGDRAGGSRYPAGSRSAVSASPSMPGPASEASSAHAATSRHAAAGQCAGAPASGAASAVKRHGLPGSRLTRTCERDAACPISTR